jgi:phage-related minor tail protein
MKQINRKLIQRLGAFMLLAYLSVRYALAQSSSGIDQATTEINSYVDPVSNLIIAIGAVVGLIGGVRVYIKWQSGDQDTQKAIMGWFGACLFLILVGVVIKAFFA